MHLQILVDMLGTADSHTQRPMYVCCFMLFFAVYAVSMLFYLCSVCIITQVCISVEKTSHHEDLEETHL